MYMRSASLHIGIPIITPETYFNTKKAMSNLNWRSQFPHNIIFSGRINSTNCLLILFTPKHLVDSHGSNSTVHTFLNLARLRCSSGMDIHNLSKFLLNFNFLLYFVKILRKNFLINYIVPN